MKPATALDHSDAAALLPEALGTLAFAAHRLGGGRLYAFTAKRCLPD